MKNRFLLVLSISILASQGETVGLWRFEENGAVEGQSVAIAVNEIDPGPLDATNLSGSPIYSADVPFAEIFDPVANSTYANGLSLDVTAANSQLQILNSTEFDTSFTIEFFVKYVGQPGSYEHILRREEFRDLAWKIDFDHGANLEFGKPRSRWDTPAGAPDDIAEIGVDENVNFVLKPQGQSDSTRIYIDTGAKDVNGVDVGDQNTGMGSDYVYDVDSGNPNDADIALQGDGINDLTDWHHIAMSFDEETQEIKFYFDYRLGQTRTLSDSQGDGYTHPAANLLFGKLSGNEGALFMDELRFSNSILTPGEFLREAGETQTEVVGHWRLEEEGAVEGGDIFLAENSANDFNDASAGNGTPVYSTDVPAPVIYDPLTDTSFENGFSFDASVAGSRLRVENDASLNSSYTLEFFMKVVGEPGGYHAFLRRTQAADLRWQVDFDHAATGAFGRLRARFDTPAGESDNVAENGVDENVNFVVGPTGGGSIPGNLRIWVDTPTGDGDPAGYVGADWADDGDGVNDDDSWHHAAISLNDETGEVSFYYDYELMQTRTLSDSEMDGYTHPDAAFEFGKLTNSDYGLLLDEIRYTAEVILPFQFLQTVVLVENDLVITSIAANSETGTMITWASNAGENYTVERSTDLASWEALDTKTADGPSTSYTDAIPPADSSQVFYRVLQD
ncbi:MAG: hypothetical protein ABF379_09850 [Akkermansiaceae bacterium]